VLDENEIGVVVGEVSEGDETGEQGDAFAARMAIMDVSNNRSASASGLYLNEMRSMP
jgi:hypothetical protein